MVKRALFIGNNKYPNAPLHGCENDVQLVSGLLPTKDWTFKILIDQTYEMMVGAIKSFADKAEKGDVLLLGYSGHGSVIPTIGSVLCPIDFARPPYITADLVRSLFQPALDAGATVVMWFDCCFSGGMLRSMAPVQGITRFHPPPPEALEYVTANASPIALKAALAETTHTGRLHPLHALVSSTAKAAPVLMGASSAQQPSTELEIGGKPYGVFTYNAVGYIRRQESLESFTYKQLHKATTKVVKQYQQPCFLPVDLLRNFFLVPITQVPKATPPPPPPKLPVVPSSSADTRAEGTPPAAVPGKVGFFSVRIWKDDPTTPEFDRGYITAYDVVGPGPTDSRIRVQVSPENPLALSPNARGDFDPPEDNYQLLELANAYGSVRSVLDMFDRTIRARTSPTFAIRWNFPILNVYTRAFKEYNAFYDRRKQSLSFGYQDMPGTEQNWVCACRSFEVVGHETGHAVLDSQWPELFGSRDAEPYVVHEAFGDLTAIMGHLSQLDFCHTLVHVTKGDLNSDNALSRLAEQLGVAIYSGSGTAANIAALRNALNSFTVGDVGKTLDLEIHELSQIFTGAVYGALVAAYNKQFNPALCDPAELLYSIGKDMCVVLSAAFLFDHPKECSISGIIKKMLKHSTGGILNGLLTQQFQTRGLMTPNAINMCFAKGTRGLTSCKTIAINMLQ
jgi:hypothetical protein